MDLRVSISSSDFDFIEYYRKGISLKSRALKRWLKKHSVSQGQLAYSLYSTTGFPKERGVTLKARLKDIENAGFRIAEICVFDTPKNFPQSGFQVGMIHLKKGIQGDIKYTRINYENK